MHTLPALDLFRSLTIILGWGRRWRSIFQCSALQDVIGVLIQREADLLVPLWMLPAALDRLGAAFLAIDSDHAVGVLLPYVPLIR